MKPLEIRITSLLLSRATGMLMLLIALAMLLSGTTLLSEVPPTADSAIRGVGTVVASSRLTAILAACFSGMIAISIISLTNRSFSIMQSTSNLYVGLFALLCASIPGALGMAMDGLLVLDTVLLCLMIMYTTYGRLAPTRRIFLVFTLLSAGSALQYAFAAFIPAMLIGCRQMRCLNLRAILAALIGIITPYWILLGFGIISIDSFQPPHIGWPTPESLTQYSLPQIIAALGIMLIAIATTLYNLVRVYGQNAKTRAFNGILAMLTFWTVAVALLDLGHLMTYIPLLAAFTAMHVTLYSHLDAYRRPYIVIIATILLSLTVFTWNLIN